MENKVIIKANGKITESVRLKLVSSSPYLKGKELCFNSFIDQDKVKKSSNLEVFEVRRCVYTMIQTITNFQSGIGLNALMEKLKKCNSLEDLIELVKLIETGFSNIINIKNVSNNKYTTNAKNNTISKTEEELKTSPELVISICIKKLISDYFLRIIMSLSNEEFNEALYLKNNLNEIEFLFDKFGISFNEECKVNGIYELSKRILNDTIDIVFDEKQKHLCFDCDKAHPFECEKITDEVKKRIDKYEFIKEGCQVFDKSGKLERFIVIECEDFWRSRAKTFQKK